MGWGGGGRERESLGRRSCIRVLRVCRSTKSANLSQRRLSMIVSVFKGGKTQERGATVDYS